MPTAVNIKQATIGLQHLVTVDIHHGCFMPIVLYTKLDSQHDKLETIIAIQLTTFTGPWQIFSNSRVYDDVAEGSTLTNYGTGYLPYSGDNQIIL